MDRTNLYLARNSKKEKMSRKKDHNRGTKKVK